MRATRPSPISASRARPRRGRGPRHFHPQALWGLERRGIPHLDSSTMTDLPLGTVFQASGGIAKDMFPDFYVGSTLDLQLGDQGWGAGLDLGVMDIIGDRGALKDLRWGAVLSGYRQSLQPGLIRSLQPLGGVRALLVRSNDWKIGVGADLSFPTFQDLAFGLSTGISFRDVVTFRVNWNQDLRELLDGSNRSLMPAFGFSAVIPLSGKSGSYLAKQGWDKAELRPAVSAAPLYGNVWAVGGGRDYPPRRDRQRTPQDHGLLPGLEIGPGLHLAQQRRHQGHPRDTR